MPKKEIKTELDVPNFTQKGNKKSGPVTQEQLEAHISYFEKEVARRKKKLKKRNKRIDDGGASVEILQSLLGMSLRLLPTAERMFYHYKNERAVYALVALVTQIRDIQTDLQRLGAADDQGTEIFDKIIVPAQQLIIQNFLRESSFFLRTLKNSLPEKYHKTVSTHVNSFMKNHAKYLGETTDSTQARVLEYFASAAASPPPSKTGSKKSSSKSKKK